VLIRDFSLPKKLGMQSTALLAEIPDGYGYGIDILNTFILLDRKTCKQHLYESKDLSKVVAAQFPFMDKDKDKDRADRKLGWFWICLHLWGSAAYDQVRSSGTSGKVSIPGSGDENSVTEASLTGLTEHLKIIRCVLKSLSDRDQATLADLRRMNRDREKTALEMKKLIDSFVFDNNWRVMRWMY
jgi:hypothetical protein